MRISDKEIGGTYLTTFYAIMNLGILYLEQIILYISVYVDVYTMTLIGWVFAGAYIICI